MEQRREREEQNAGDDLDEEDLEQLQDSKDEQDALLEQARPSYVAECTPARSAVLVARSVFDLCARVCKCDVMVAQVQQRAARTGAARAQVISAAGSLLKRFQDAALPYAEQLLQQHFSAKLMDARSSHEDRWAALMLVSDMVEHCPSSGKYLPSLMPKFIECARVDSKDVVNVACYCLGVVAEKHPAVRLHAMLAASLVRCGADAGSVTVLHVARQRGTR